MARKNVRNCRRAWGICDDAPMTRSQAAVEAARWKSPEHVWIDHAVLTNADVAWLSTVRRLTLWAVRLPVGFLAKLPDLESLDIRGGSGNSAGFVDGCAELRVLVVNQIRGMTDLRAIEALTNLELLSLYGLPKVSTLPSAEHLGSLTRAELGSMKGLSGLGPLLRAPALRELLLIRAVKLGPDDPQVISSHPSIEEFGWYAEDVPDKTWLPVVDAVAKPRPALLSNPEEWLEER